MCTVSQGPCIYPRKYKRPPGGRPTKVVCKTVGRTRCSPLPTGSHQARISPTLQRTSQVVQDPLHNQQVQRSRQKQCLIDFYSRPPRQKCYREGKQRRQPLVLQPTVFGPKTRETMETCDRSKPPKSVPHGLEVQDGNPGINLRITQVEWVTSIDLSDAYLHIPIHPQSRKFLRFHHKGIS